MYSLSPPVVVEKVDAVLVLVGVPTLFPLHDHEVGSMSVDVAVSVTGLPAHTVVSALPPFTDITGNSQMSSVMISLLLHTTLAFNVLPL